jgi:rhamnose utilization protein RhaD (predicted bifunctional aldolase and dehydrogenase)
MTLEYPRDFDDLRRASARIGADPLLIQSAGGNFSVKEGGAMWIKASGMLLAEALTRDVFVPVDLAAMREAVKKGSPSADHPSEFLLEPSPLRPSVETCLHAIFPQRVVMHAHCVNTLAFAIRADARERLAERLAGFAWIFQPYVKPGGPLAAAISQKLAPGVDVVVLGNHGVLVAGDSVGETETLLRRVASALSAKPAEAGRPDLEALAALAGDGYRPGEADHPLHGVALTPRVLEIALGGAFYPDHVVFCGVDATALAPGETVRAVVARRAAAGLAPPVFLLVPGKGVLIRSEASAGSKALARCFGDVLLRLPPEARPVYLTADQCAALLDWDAEKYRLALNAR